MRNLLWIGVFFISASLLYSIPIFNDPEPLISFFLISLGVICNILSFWTKDSIVIDKKYIIFLVPLVFSLIIINYPYNVGLIILAFGILLAFLTNYFSIIKKTGMVVNGLIFSGIIICFQVAFFPIYSLFVSHGHRIDILSPVVSFFGNILGLNSSVNNGIVYVQSIQQTYSFTTTFEKFGFFIWFNILIGAVVIFFLFFYNKKKIGTLILIFLTVSFFYLIIRYVSFIFLYINTLQLDVLWDPTLVILSFLPLTLLFIKLLPLKNEKISIYFLEDFSFSKKQIIAILLICLFTFCIVGSVAFQDPGIKKNGKILIDEYHSDWEDSIRPLDKQWYGLNSTYNYYSLANWLNNYYSINQNVDSEITYSLLQDYDILILKCPTNSYSYEEIRSIVQFVKQGGGLYLIGDHTDVFGMNTFLNQVSLEFGIKFNMDATYELGTGDMTIYKPYRMMSHPIVHNLDKFEFMTSCTLNAPLFSENVIIGNRIISEPGTYSTQNFFRESVSSSESEYGLLLQVAALKYGKGRVVAFSDSTVFSSFSIFSDGYERFNFGVFEYLNRENYYSYLNTIFFGIAILALFGSIYILRNDKKIKILFLFIIIGFFMFAMSAPVFSYINHENYDLPVKHTDYVNVCFEQEYSNYTISLKPNIGFFTNEDNYGTFYVWTQRVNCTPSIEKTLDNSLEKGEIIVIINPTKEFTKKDTDLITDYVNNGGRVLLMDSITNVDSTANQIIAPFDMSIQKNKSLPDLKYIIENLTNGKNMSNYLRVSGGEKIIINKTNNASINFFETFNEDNGKVGKFVVFTDSYIFSDIVMGGTFVEPDDTQLMIYDISYYIFEKVLLTDCNIK